MKRIYILLCFVLLIFSGCTSDFKVDENKVKDISDKITETIIEKTASERAEKTESHKLEASDLNELIIDNAVGSINILCNESTEATVDLKIKANSKEKKDAEKLLSEFSYTVEAKRKALVIDTSQYSKDLKDSDGISTDLDIKIPSNIVKITVKSNVGELVAENINGEFNAIVNVGNIKINNSGSSYDIKADVGDISLRGGKITGKSQFNTNTGNISVETDDISEAKNIVAETNVGNISMRLPESSNYKAEINEFMKEKRTESKGDGKTSIRLTSNVGKIDFK